MAEFATAGIAALASGASTLFTYNRDAFIFERTLYQGMVHQEQAMRVQEAALYREDLRDLFDLTIKKMDSYLVINTLMLGFAVSLFCTATVPQGTPDWLFWLYSLSLVGSCVFLLLSVWLALQASLTAQTYSVRLLTQWMRLPVPSRRDIEKATSKLKDYERAGAGKLLRLPALAGEGSSDDRTSEEGSSEEDRGMIKRKTSLIMGGRELHESTLTHFRLFSSIQQHWSGLDSYSRVFMTIGANQLLQCIGHFSLSYFMILGQQLWAPLSFVLCITFAEYLHVRLNILMNTKAVIITVGLLGLVPFLSYFATLSFIRNGEESFQTRSIVVLCFFSHLAWLLYTLYQGYEHKRGLPRRFITVGLVTDILGDGPMKRTLDRALAGIGRGAKEIPVGAAANVATHPLDLPFLQGHGDAANFGELETKAKKLERRIQKLFEAWKQAADVSLGVAGPAGGVSDLDRAMILRSRFRKLQKALQSAGRHSVTNDGLTSPMGSILSTSPRSSRFATGNAGWLQMRVEGEAGGAGNPGGVYYLNPTTGEIRMNAPDLADGLAVGATEPRVSARERQLRAEMAEFAKFVQEAREIRDRRRRARPIFKATEEPPSRLVSDDSETLLRPRRRRSSDYSDTLKKRPEACMTSSDRKHSTGTTIHGWWIFRQAAALLITAWVVSTVWAVCRWLDVETGDQHVVEGERTPLRERKDVDRPFSAASSSGHGSIDPSPRTFASVYSSADTAINCVPIEDFPWEPLFFPVRMRALDPHGLLFTDGPTRQGYTQDSNTGKFAYSQAQAAPLMPNGLPDAQVCIEQAFRVAVSVAASAHCYGVLEPAGAAGVAAQVSVERNMFTYPDRVELMDVAVAPGDAARPGSLVFLTSDGRLDVWDLVTKIFRRSFTRCRESTADAVDWRSIAVQGDHLYVLGVKHMRPLLKRISLDALKVSG